MLKDPVGYKLTSLVSFPLELWVAGASWTANCDRGEMFRLFCHHLGYPSVTGVGYFGHLGIILDTQV